nr:glycosyltransferase [Periweissella ghanensis]
MKLSFSIVTYNNQNEIRKIINNINDVVRDYDYVIYVIDNGSIDATVLEVNELIGNNDRIKLLKSANLGFGHGHNLVLGLLESDYHFIVNPDIILPNEKDNLNNMLDFLEKNKDVGLLTPQIRNQDGSVQLLLRNEPTVFDASIRFMGKNLFKKRQNKFINLESGYNKIMETQNATGCFMVFRSNVFQQINGFDPRYFMYYEDSDITKKTKKVAKTIFFPFSYVTHQWQRDNKKKIKFVYINIMSLIKFMNKWGWKLY